MYTNAKATNNAKDRLRN